LERDADGPGASRVSDGGRLRVAGRAGLAVLDGDRGVGEVSILNVSRVRFGCKGRVGESMDAMGALAVDYLPG
jgi:hypothetical protein